MDEYKELKLHEKVIVVIPAGGYGTRMTPLWTIVDPLLDAFPKPAMTELSSGKTFLDIIFDTVLEESVAKRVLLRIGPILKPVNEIVTFDEKMLYKFQVELLKIAEKRLEKVIVYHNNPDGNDDGTGATVVSREAKRFLEANPQFEYVLILASDIPTIPASLLKEMILYHIKEGNALTLASVIEDDPTGYGRVVRYPPDSGEFIDVIEQTEIGNTPEERKGFISFSFDGFEVSFSKEELHQIKERCVLLEVMNREIFLNAIRDIDAPNYARVIRDETGQEIGLIPNFILAQMRDDADYIVANRKFSKATLTKIYECRKIEPASPNMYVLERHKKNEYYLPELAREVKLQGKKVGIFRLPKGSAKSFDTRTDIRLYAQKKLGLFPEREPNKKLTILGHRFDNLTILKEEQVQMLEQVFGVTVYPDAEIFVDSAIYSFLLSLVTAVSRLGGAKEFCDRYFQELKAYKFSAIPGLEKFGASSFYVGVHTVLKGKIGLSGSVSIEPWVRLENSVVQNSKISRGRSVENEMVIGNEL